MTRQPAGKPRDKRKGRRRPVAPRPPVAARPRVAPVAGGTKVAQPSPTPARRVPGMMDFSYVNAELRRILIFIVGMVGLLIVLSFIVH